jgi:hypothetical protein
MKLVAIAIGLVVLTIVVFAFRKASSGGQRPAPAMAKPKTLEEKLATLEKCGLTLKAPFTVDELLKSWDREEYEKDGYESVLMGLGMTEEQEPWRDHSGNIWNFDTEAIQDNGDYKRIAERMVELSQGGLILENIKDHVEVEKGQAWLSFTFKGKPIKVDLAVKDDWVDATIFARFVELLKQSDPSKIYIYYDLGGQDCLIGCATKENFACLKNLGLKFTPL